MMQELRIANFGFWIARVWLLAVVAVCFAGAAAAQKSSFLYIQGDGKTPIYVKVSGETAPRYGKNYCIVPDLLAGVHEVEILFQQNLFPPQKFSVRMPEGGERGFLVVEKSGAISLYDLQQGFYLTPGNSPDDDHLPPATTVATIATPAAPSITSATPVRPKPNTEERQSGTTRPPRTDEARTTRATEPTTRAANSASAEEGPRFIPGVTLGGEGVGRARTGTTAEAGGCGVPMEPTEFAPLYRRALNADDQDSRLSLLMGLTGECFSVTQLRLLVRTLTGDAARYTALKKLQSRLNSPARFAELEDLLKADAYRTRFRELLQP